MIFDINGKLQPAVGKSQHWSMFHAVASQPDIYDPASAAVTAAFDAEVAGHSIGASVDSRVVVSNALASVGSWWHGEFPRRFPNFENGAHRGIFGMILWNYLAKQTTNWSFQTIEDSHGAAQTATRYWKI